MTRTKDILYEVNILCDCPRLKQQLQHDEHVLIGPKKKGFGPWQIETKLSCQINQNSICLDLMEEFMRRSRGGIFSGVCATDSEIWWWFGNGVGCISCDGVGPLPKIDGRMKGKDYIDLLSANLLPYMQSMGPEYTFMDDNAPCH